MASQYLNHRVPASAGAPTLSSGLESLPAEVLLPVLAGAQARGMADTFTMLGLPAVFLGGDGRVLHGEAAIRSMSGVGLEVRAEHLVAATAADNERLSHFIAALLTGQADGTRATSSIALTRPAGESMVRVIGISQSGATSSIGQLVRAILLVDDGQNSVASAFLACVAQGNPGSVSPEPKL